jgi:hypothetical protein
MLDIIAEELARCRTLLALAALAHTWRSDRAGVRDRCQAIDRGPAGPAGPADLA